MAGEQKEKPYISANRASQGSSNCSRIGTMCKIHFKTLQIYIVLEGFLLKIMVQVRYTLIARVAERV